MSRTLNFQKKRIVEYEHTGMFNWGVEAFHNILDALNVDYTVVDESCPEYDENFEILRDSLRAAIDSLRQIKEGKSPDTVDEDDVKDAIKEQGYTIDEIIKLLVKLETESDQSHEYIWVSFF